MRLGPIDAAVPTISARRKPSSPIAMPAGRNVK
jgi:hypothetical protein